MLVKDFGISQREPMQLLSSRARTTVNAHMEVKIMKKQATLSPSTRAGIRVGAPRDTGADERNGRR